MHSRGLRPLASSMVLLMAASVSPAMGWASWSVKSWQASTLRGAPGLESAPPRQPASEASDADSAAASRNGAMRSRADVVTRNPSLGLREGFYPGSLDLDPPPLALLLLRQRDRDLEDAVLEVGLRLIGAHPLGERDGAVELAVAALAAVDTPLVPLLLLAPLPVQHEVVVVDLQVDVLLLHPRQVGADHEVAAPLRDLDLGIPEALPQPGGARGRGKARGPRAAEAAAREVVEEAVHLIHHRAHHPEGGLEQGEGAEIRAAAPGQPHR